MKTLKELKINLASAKTAFDAAIIAFNSAQTAVDATRAAYEAALIDYYAVADATSVRAENEVTNMIKATFDGNLVLWDDSIIRPGDSIKLHFAGGPNDMPSSWILVQAYSVFSTVNGKENPAILVRAANGDHMLFERADYYSLERG